MKSENLNHRIKILNNHKKEYILISKFYFCYNTLRLDQTWAVAVQLTAKMQSAFWWKKAGLNLKKLVVKISRKIFTNDPLFMQAK